jgi:hypothetical protein
VKVGSPSLIHIELCASRHLRQFAVYSRRYAQAPDFRAASLQIRRARAGELGNQLSLTPYSGSLAVATRLLECCQLRVQDVDFAANQIVVRSGKDDKDGVTMLPGLVKSALARHLEIVREQHRRDLQDGAGWVELPMALMRKYPNAGREWAWHGSSRRRACMWTAQPVRSAGTTCTVTVLQRLVKAAVRRAGIAKAGYSAHPPSFLRDTSARRQPRHPYRSRIAGSPRRHDDADLYPRTGPRARRRTEPGRSHARRMRRRTTCRCCGSGIADRIGRRV